MRKSTAATAVGAIRADVEHLVEARPLSSDVRPVRANRCGTGPAETHVETAKRDGSVREGYGRDASACGGPGELLVAERGGVSVCRGGCGLAADAGAEDSAAGRELRVCILRDAVFAHPACKAEHRLLFLLRYGRVPAAAGVWLADLLRSPDRLRAPAVRPPR